MVVFAGQGDARRSMDLLWRDAAPPGPAAGPRPGPRPGLSVDAIVDAAIAVADAEGSAALSMRAVGERLGRTAMALYTYVPGKAELLDLMYDRALGELPSGYGGGAGDGGWRAAVTAWAQDTWTFYLRHPWMLQVSQARPVLGPGEYRALEGLLDALSGAGLGARDERRAVATLSSVVRGAARTAAEARQAAAATGTPEDEWWYARSAVLSRAAPDFAERFPRVARLSASGAFDDDAFDGSFDDGAGGAGDDATAGGEPGAGEDVLYQELAAREALAGGLALVLDGIEAAVARADR